MRSVAAALTFGASLLASDASAIADGPRDAELCAKLAAFERAPFTFGKTGYPLRRSVTLHFLGNFWAFDGTAHFHCDTDGSQASEALCTWLPRHTSLEFPSSLPLRILRCHGYRIPAPFTQWRPWLLTTGLSAHLIDRSVEMRVDIGTHKTLHDAVRITVIPAAEGDVPADTPLIDSVDNPRTD